MEANDVRDAVDRKLQAPLGRPASRWIVAGCVAVAAAVVIAWVVVANLSHQAPETVRSDTKEAPIDSEVSRTVDHNGLARDSIASLVSVSLDADKGEIGKLTVPLFPGLTWSETVGHDQFQFWSKKTIRVQNLSADQSGQTNEVPFPREFEGRTFEAEVSYEPYLTVQPKPVQYVWEAGIVAFYQGIFAYEGFDKPELAEKGGSTIWRFTKVRTTESGATVRFAALRTVDVVDEAACSLTESEQAQYVIVHAPGNPCRGAIKAIKFSVFVSDPIQLWPRQ